MTGPNEYTQATWLMNPNHDLASVIVLGPGKLHITCIMDSEGVTLEGVIVIHPDRICQCLAHWSRKSKV